MQVQHANESERSSLVMKNTLHPKMKFNSLSNKLGDVLKELDKKASLIAASSQQTEVLLPYVQQLEEILFELRVWTNDINIKRPKAEGKPLPMREWTTSDCLNILDAGQGPTAADLRGTLDQMTTIITDIPVILAKITNGTNATR